MRLKTKKNMVFMVLVSMCVCMLAGCITIESPAAQSSIQDEAAVAMIDTTLLAVNNLKQEIDILYDQSTQAIRDVIKLEHLGVPALEWVQYMSKQADLNGWSLRRVNVTSDLKLFKNDVYEIVRLQFSVDAIAPKRVYSHIITVYETAIAKEYKYESLHSDLETKAKSLYGQWLNKVRAEQLAITTVKKVAAKSDSWSVSKIDGASYQVKGDGLGMGASALTAGEWIFNKSANKMEPSNDVSMSLYRIISGQG